MPTPNRLQLKTVEEGLYYYTVDELKKILQILPLAAAPSRKAEIVDEIATYLLGPGLKQQWQALNQLQQAAVAEAIYRNEGYYQHEQFKAKYGSAPKWPTLTSFDRYRLPAAALDLFFYPTAKYTRDKMVPVDLQKQLKAFVPEPKTLDLPSTDRDPETVTVYRRHYDRKHYRSVAVAEQVPATLCRTEQAAQQDLLAVLRLVQLGKVSVSDKTLMPSKATLQAIAPLLHGGDYYGAADEPDDGSDPIGVIKPFAWVMLVQAGGLASLDGKKLQLTKAGQKAMGAAPSQTIKTIWKKWLKTTLLDELRRVDAIKGQTGKAKRGLTAVSGRRAQIAELLSECPVGHWVECDRLKRYAIASDRSLTVSRSPEHLYISDSHYGSLYGVEAGRWSILEDAYLRCVLFEYAATLGMLDVAYTTPYEGNCGSDLDEFWGTDDLSFLSRYDGLKMFRLTPLGALCLGLTATYTVAPVVADSTLRVLPNLDIVMAGAPLNPSENLLMETFTRKTGDAVWKLDREAALKAVEAGHSLPEFQKFLTDASAGELPQIVQQFFQDCCDRAESLQDRGMARLIECADGTLAVTIAHDSRTKKYCQLAGERYLVVPVEQETRFRNGLRKLGYSLPLSSNG